jgi:hypothetical protein
MYNLYDYTGGSALFRKVIGFVAFYFVFFRVGKTWKSFLSQISSQSNESLQDHKDYADEYIKTNIDLKLINNDVNLFFRKHYDPNDDDDYIAAEKWNNFKYLSFK